jgi:hypothetical protein
MTNCSPAGKYEATSRPLEREGEPASRRETGGRSCDAVEPPAPPRRRFAEILERRPPPAGPSSEAEQDGERARLAAAAATLAGREFGPDRAAPDRPGPSPSAAAAPDIGLNDVRAATGPEGDWLRFTVDEGDFAGLRMAFLLRGDVLDVTLDASAAGALDRLQAREREVREALAARGLTLGRYDADRERDDRSDGDEGEREERDAKG